MLIAWRNRVAGTDRIYGEVAAKSFDARADDDWEAGQTASQLPEPVELCVPIVS